MTVAILQTDNDATPTEQPLIYPTAMKLCDDVLGDFERRNQLTLTKIEDMHTASSPRSETPASRGCNFRHQTSESHEIDSFDFLVAISTEWNHDYPAVPFRPFLIAGMNGETRCFPNGVAGRPIRPVCDIKVNLSDGQAWFRLRYDEPQGGGVQESEAITQEKLVDLASQIIVKIPPEKRAQ
ncbi:hypothetical protein [Nocardia camponoti]|uniref:hypothetical protein n=1 Tax=Nocardia camponoti TaxID=1616106 RepID=UPI00166F01FE|nr:hypothetical protein [Nocardia camponoti]